MRRDRTGLGRGIRYMSANEYCAYLHARTERAEESSSTLALEYDDHYCRYFSSHESVWTLHLSDDQRSRFAAETPEKGRVTVPAGLGRHLVRIDGSTF